jgi:hypothetical protein
MFDINNPIIYKPLNISFLRDVFIGSTLKGTCISTAVQERIFNYAFHILQYYTSIDVVGFLNIEFNPRFLQLCQNLPILNCKLSILLQRLNFRSCVLWQCIWWVLTNISEYIRLMLSIRIVTCDNSKLCCVTLHDLLLLHLSTSNVELALNVPFSSVQCLHFPPAREH